MLSCIKAVLAITALVFAVTACSAPVDKEHVGPCIHGRVTDVHGTPKVGVQVRAYGGFATRWGIGGTVTDENGYYELCGLEGGGMIKDEESGEWDLYVGVCVGDSEGQNPAAVLPWKDVRLANKADALVELNFNCSLDEIAAIE